MGRKSLQITNEFRTSHIPEEQRYLCGMLKSSSHRLRAMEPTDLDLLFQLENSPSEWWMGAQLAPLSRATLERYIAGDHDLYRDLQLRLIIETRNGNAVGAVDLYQLDPRNRRAGVGVAIAPGHRKAGHAKAGLELLVSYAFEHLDLHQLWAEIPAMNDRSLTLFEKAGFATGGRFTDWIRAEGTWHDAIWVQCISNFSAATTPIHDE